MESLKIIAKIKTDFPTKFGIPRQSGLVDTVGKIVFEKEYKNPAALKGLEDFSHLWLIWGFSEVDKTEWSPTVRPPRLGGNKRVGVFATRSPFRPNNLGLSCVKLEKVKNDKNFGDILVVSGVDLLDNTPIYDIKPYIPYSDCKPDAKGSFGEALKDENIDVFYQENVFFNIDENIKNAVISIIEQNPKPAYKQQEKEYKFLFSDYEISFIINENKATILNIQKIN